MARPIRARDAGTVENKSDSSPMESDIHQHLVKRPIDERCVQRDDWMQPAECEASRRSDGVLFSDPDIEDSFRILRRELEQARRPQHRGRDSDNLVVLIRQPNDLVCENGRPGRIARGIQRLTGFWIYLANRMELVCLVQNGRLVTLAFLRDDVHDHRRGILFRLS